MSKSKFKSLQAPLIKSVALIVIDVGEIIKQKIQVLITCFVIVIIALFYLLNIRGGHNWGGDFSMYIMNAKNIANGHPYAQTNYIYNVDTASYGPKAYPPVYPLMLAPIILSKGINLASLKLVGVVCFVILLYYLNKYILPNYISPIIRIMFIIMVGLYPDFFIQVDSILSDIPFMLFCAISLHRFNEQVLFKGSTRDYLDACLTGIVIYLAFGTRSIGITLLPVVFILDLIRNKRLSPFSILTISVSLFLIFLQSILIPETGSYLDQIPKSIGEAISTVLASLAYYFIMFYQIFRFESPVVQEIVYIFVLGFVVIAFIDRVKNQISSYDLFFLVYSASLLLWPSTQGLRFLFPIIPFYLLFFLEGFQKLVMAIRTPKWLPNAISTLLLFSLVFYYFDIFTNLVPRPVSEIEKPETQELFRYVRSKTNPSDIIVFFKPRVLALFTERKSVAVAVPAPNGDTLKRLNELTVNYVIVRANYSMEYQPQLGQLVKEHSEHFRLVYQNDDFLIYQYINTMP